MPTPDEGSPFVNTERTGNVFTDALEFGVKWASPTLTFSFPQTGATWSTILPGIGYGSPSSGDFPWVGFTPLNGTLQGFVRSALQSVAQVSGVVATEVADTASNVGDLRFAATTALSLESYAVAEYPGYARGGDVWINGNHSTWFNTGLTQGSYEYLAVIHEVGHALGLKHPHDYSVNLPAGYDSRSYTVMSYAATPGDRQSTTSFYPTTPMLLDVAALQHLYGRNDAHAAGNDVYVFDEWKTYYETIWDGGGTDTLQFSGNSATRIDLGEGNASRLGQPVLLFRSNGEPAEAIDNVWIAFDTVIERAIGGSGNDTLIGNAVKNLLDGGPGADTMSGGKGNDTYKVDNPWDRVVETAGEGVDTVHTSVGHTLASNVENVRVIGSGGIAVTGNAGANAFYAHGFSDAFEGGAGTDVVSYRYASAAVKISLDVAATPSMRGSGSLAGIENLAGSVYGDTLLGNRGANLLSGNKGNDVLKGGAGNDRLEGGSGNDRLEGASGNDRLQGASGSDSLQGASGKDTLDGGAGKDKLAGGSGADSFAFTSALSARSNVDTISDFSSVDDRLLLDNAVFASLGPTGALSRGMLRGGSKALDSNDYLLYDRDAGKLYYDADASGKAAATLFAVFDEDTAVARADFWIT